MSNDRLYDEVRRHLAEYVNVRPEDFQMSADLESAYDMDSTELTALAQELHQRYGVRVERSDRDDWSTGEHICKFLEESLAAGPSRSGSPL